MNDVIRLVTEIPGPRSRELKGRASDVVARAIGPHGLLFVASGEGAVIEDVDGNRFIDLIGGVGCLAAGHSHPRVVEAIRRQLQSFTHTDFSVLPYEVYLELAERLSELCGGRRRVALFNTGAEAVENAVKIARAATGRPGILCFDGAFHGRSYMAMTLTSRNLPFKEGFGPFVPGVHRAPYPLLGDGSVEASLEAVSSILRDQEVAAVVIEPVLGEGGFIVPPRGFLSALSEMCRAASAALIADEVQCGYGRTGTFLASEQFGVRPDILLLGKSIGGGLPLSAVVGDPAWMDAPDPNALGGTFPGNPIACAAAVAVLDVIKEEGLMERAVAIGELLKKSWLELAATRDSIVEVRGLGAMVGVEFRPPGAGAVVEAAMRRGVLAMTAGEGGAVLRHLPPLVISDAGIEEALGVLADSLEDTPSK